MARFTGAALAVGSLAFATLVTYALKTWADIDNPSSVYLLAVASVAFASGTMAAVATAVGSFVLYNFLFVEPKFSLVVAEPQSVLTLLLLLLVGVIIGRLTSLGRDRAAQAARREREARALFAITRALASSPSTEAALGAVVERLVAESEVDRAWIALGPTTVRERVVADSDPSSDPPVSSHHALLRRDPAEADARWVRIHAPSVARRPASASGEVLRVEMVAGEETFGSLYARRRERAGNPTIETSRLLSVAADQSAQALRRDRLARRALDVEVAERSDAAKSALLDLVSHELRTPLAAIRASAGSLADRSIKLTDGERHDVAEAIDVEVMRLNRLVENLLDMSRLQAGRVSPDIEVIPLRDAIESVLERFDRTLGGRRVETNVPDDVPPVLADATYLEQVIANLIENAARYTPREAPIHVTAASVGRGVDICVEDGGPGVSDEDMGRIFERFFRARGRGTGSGTGLGLALVKGLVETMNGSVSAARSGLGGLAIRVHLPAAEPPR